MPKIAFIFPGQGAQYVGMGRDVCERYPSASEIFDRASAALGYDIKKVVFEGDEETLKITEYTQPAILTTSIALMQPLLENGVRPDYAAGLSLGEYCAHVAAGTMTFEDAVSLVRKRGKFMQEAVPIGQGAMAAILGLDTGLVIECCREASAVGVVEPANFNCPGQIVIAGETEAVDKAVELCSAKGAKRAVNLEVSAPFHCSLLKPAGEKLAMELEKVEFYGMKLPVVSNATAEYVTDKGLVKDLLIRQVSSPVRWEDSMRRLIADGIDTFVEIGPGKTLAGFMRKIDRNVKMLNVENLESLENTLEALGAGV